MAKSGMKTRKKQRLLVMITGIVVLFAAVFLVLFAMGKDSLSLFLQPSGVQERQMEPGRHFRLGGLVAMESYSKAEDGLTHQFTVTDCVVDVPVVFKGLLPDLFREGQGIVSEGALNEDGVFVATTVLAKHDENYAPPGTMPTNTDACVHPGG
ncbi:cytochrome c-type biogenesis protein CcmE [Kordiimonas sediminis]|uniref:Cytochrome c-type biogenesis protein CcmE n=1 Tax=Kordiimonas sediminis TaxID=1735581 RepID=A0A919ALM5_9PROT|nr:cytochrome c maturation protein CcmE [Kordiimonas sediminis]GHF14398.1 cytochrome c-type biogenesis protein CcmE [Kordiimonas sediminis]